MKGPGRIPGGTQVWPPAANTQSTNSPESSGNVDHLEFNRSSPDQIILQQRRQQINSGIAQLNHLRARWDLSPQQKAAYESQLSNQIRADIRWDTGLYQPIMQLKTDAVLKEWLHGHSEHQEAVVGFLTHVLNPPIKSEATKLEGQSDLLAHTCRALEFLDDDRVRASLQNLVLNVSHPGYLQMLARPIMSMFDAKTIEGWIAGALKSKNQLHIANALNLVYYVFSVEPDIALSAQARELIASRLSELKAEPDINPHLRAVIDDFEMPESFL